MFNDTLTQTAKALAAHCNNGTESEGLDTLYHPDCVSAEALAMPGSPMPREAKGLDAIRAKHAWWENANEVHSTSADGPFLHEGNQFSLVFHMDVTGKDSGERVQMSEVGLYTVDDAGKITREEFFYPPMG